MKFCPTCNNRVESTTVQGTLKFKCAVCGESDTIKLEPEDTLIMVFRTNTIIHDQGIRDIAHLPCASLVNETCANCKAKIVARNYVTHDLRPLYSCKCGYQWTQTPAS